MREYRQLKVAVFDDERFSWTAPGSNGLSMKLSAFAQGVFHAAKVYGAIDHAPGEVQSFNNPTDVSDLDALAHTDEGLAKQVRDMAQGRVRNIRVYDAEILDERILAAFHGIPHIVQTGHSVESREYR